MESLINETKKSLESVNIDIDTHKKARQETIDRVVEAKFILSLLDELKNPQKESTWDEKKELEDSHNYAVKFVEKATEEAKIKIQNSKNKTVWQMFKHANGEVYYKNSETGETRWEKPIGFDEKQIETVPEISISKDQPATVILESLAIKPSYVNSNTKSLEMLLYYYENDFGTDDQWKEIVQNNTNKILNTISSYLLPENSIEQQYYAFKILCSFCIDIILLYFIAMYVDNFFTVLNDLISDEVNIWECFKSFIEQLMLLDDFKDYINWSFVFIKQYVIANHDLNTLPNADIIKQIYSLLCNVDSSYTNIIINTLGQLQMYYIGDKHPMISELTSDLEFTVIGELLLHYINEYRYPYTDADQCYNVLKWIDNILNNHITANIFYANDINVFIDMILSELRNLPPDDSFVELYANILYNIMINTKYLEYKYKLGAIVATVSSIKNEGCSMNSQSWIEKILEMKP